MRVVRHAKNQRHLHARAWRHSAAGSRSVVTDPFTHATTFTSCPSAAGHRQGSDPAF